MLCLWLKHTTTAHATARPFLAGRSSEAYRAGDCPVNWAFQINHLESQLWSLVQHPWQTLHPPSQCLHPVYILRSTKPRWSSKNAFSAQASSECCMAHRFQIYCCFVRNSTHICSALFYPYCNEKYAVPFWRRNQILQTLPQWKIPAASLKRPQIGSLLLLDLLEPTGGIILRWYITIAMNCLNVSQSILWWQRNLCLLSCLLGLQFCDRWSAACMCVPKLRKAYQKQDSCCKWSARLSKLFDYTLHLVIFRIMLSSALHCPALASETPCATPWLSAERYARCLYNCQKIHMHHDWNSAVSDPDIILMEQLSEGNVAPSVSRHQCLAQVT